MSSESCVFCKIIKGDIPSDKVYEDDHVLAFLDITPRAKGHTLVIPKVHTENLLDLNDELLGFFMNGIKRTQERIDHVLQPDGYNIGWNHGDAGGQVVPHLHVHIMPRWYGDGGSNMHAIVDNPGHQTTADVARLFAR